jgi:hypothetical protein
MTKYPNTVQGKQQRNRRSPWAAATLPTLQVRTSPRPTDASPPGAVAAALHDIPPATTLSRPLEGTTQRLHHAQNYTLVKFCLPRPRLHLHLENKSWHLATQGTASTSTSSPLPPIPSVVGFSILASPAYRLLPLPFWLSSATRRPPTQLAMPHCVTVALTCPWTREYQVYVLCQCSVATAHAFLNLFRELRDPKGGAGGPEA